MDLRFMTDWDAARRRRLATVLTCSCCVALVFGALGYVEIGSLWSGAALGVLMAGAFAIFLVRTLRAPTSEVSRPRSRSNARFTRSETFLLLAGLAFCILFAFAADWRGALAGVALVVLALSLAFARRVLSNGRRKD